MNGTTIDAERYEYVLEALGVVSRLTENKRLALRHGHLDIADDNKLLFLIRWWKGDKRDTLLEKVKSIFNEGISMARSR